MTKTLNDDVVVAVDQGTGSTKAVAINGMGRVIARTSRDIGLQHPRPGSVEQSADEIASSVDEVLAELYGRIGRPFAAIGLSTQRESAVAWDTSSGRPLTHVVGWQDRRTADRSEQLGASGAAQTIREISGLPVDPMFSALKFEWMLDRIDPDRSRSHAGQITLGTVDAWLIRHLTGERRIEIGNASRTQLLDHRTGEWSDELLDVFHIPRAALPDVNGSDTPTSTIGRHELGRSSSGARVNAVLGDSHAALFGHGIRKPGAVKATYGTGSSVMGLSDGPAVGGVVDTIAWSVGGVIAHAFEGNILSTGATLVWLGDILGMSPAELAALAETAEPAEVDIVPGFAGLAAPWWDERAVGTISGLTLGTSRAQLARAATDSIVLQIEDVLRAAETAGCIDTISTVHVDGGPSSNDWLMQHQADVSGRTIVRPATDGLSALGAAWLAGASVGLWSVDVAPWDDGVRTFVPAVPDEDADARRARWCRAIERSRLHPHLNRGVQAIPIETKA